MFREPDYIQGVVPVSILWGQVVAHIDLADDKEEDDDK